MLKLLRASAYFSMYRVPYSKVAEEFIELYFTLYYLPDCIVNDLLRLISFQCICISYYVQLRSIITPPPIVIQST